MPIIQFAFWKYTLKPKTRIGAVATLQEREGALLRVRWPDGLVGFADLFPWPEFGDQSVDTQLIDLKAGKISNGLEQTIHLARRDAMSRDTGGNLLRGLPRVRNHFLINDMTSTTDDDLNEARKLGFEIIKIKCGKNIAAELDYAQQLVKKGFRLRLDFNSRSTPAEFHQHMSAIPEAYRQKIDFVEDPFVFEAAAWKAASELVTLAVDQESSRVPWDQFSESNPPPFKVIVMKPARQDITKSLKLVNRYRLKIAFTSSLDHPVGIIHAAAVCAELKKVYPNQVLDSGCFSHTSYEPELFSMQLPKHGPFISEIPGSGIGFDQLLNSLPWTELKDL